jgi:hypothetical protein
MSAFYESIGRTVVTVIRLRFRRQIRIAGALAVVGAVLVGYLLATRDVEEG